MKIKALIFFILEPFLIVVYEGKYLLPSKFLGDSRHACLWNSGLERHEILKYILVFCMFIGHEWCIFM